MPGLLTTTSHSSNARIPSGPVDRTARPSISEALGASSTRTGATPSTARRRMLACPSTPRPQTPTLASASADQEIGWRIALRDVVRPARREERGDIGLCLPCDPRHLVAQPAQLPAVLPVRALGRQEHGGAALVDVAHALKGAGVVAETEQGTEARLVGRVLQRLGPPEDRLEVGARHVGRQDEVDEAALVARPAPVVEPPRRVLVEGAVAAAEDMVVLAPPRELLGHPQLGARAEIAEHR